MNEQPEGADPLEPPGDQAFRRRDAGELHHMQPEMTWGGALSFLRRTYSRDPDVLAAADVVITGIPFDMATSNRPGARLGPRAIRAASTSIAELPAYPWGFDPFATIAAVDYGDCWFDWGYPTHAVERIDAHAEAILDTGSKMVSLGGDHFVTYPILRAHARHHGPMALIHFDAHSDTWSDDGERLDHGSMFLRAAREGLVDPTRSVQIGIRTHNDHDHGYTVLGAPWIHREGIGAVLEVVHEIVGDHPAYLTFDIDCLDPAFAPGTGTPVVGGLTTTQALEAVRGLGDLDIRGADVVEVAPAYDVSEITAYAAAQLMHDVICLWAIGGGAEPAPTGRT